MNTEPQTAARAGGSTRPVLRALRKAGGRVTLGDAVAATGLPSHEVEATLRALLETRRGHLEVGESGTLAYRFDPRLIQRDAEPFFSRFARKSWAAFREAFKVWTVLMLVVYFVVFVALLIAALMASQGKGGGRSRGRGLSLGRSRGGGFSNLWLWYFFWSPGWGWRRPYYGQRWERQYGSAKGNTKVPFIKKVFSFVFGPDSPRPTQAQKDRGVIRLIRARQGVLTAAELVQHTGLPLQSAEDEMTRIMVAHNGDVRVTGKGVLTYIFPELMVSARGTVSEREPDPAWRRLEPDESVTGNTGKTNALIGGMNGFNLVAAISAPWFIFPQLELGGPLAWVGLVWVPVVFSTLFFSVPLLRGLTVRRRNLQRRERNIRKVLLGHVLTASLSPRGPQWVSGAGASEHAKTLRLPSKGMNSRDRQATPRSHFLAEVGWDRGFQDQLQELTAEFDGEVEETPDGTARYRFPEIRLQFRGAEQMRRRLRLETQEIGDIVYASDQTDGEADQREVEAFEREVGRQDDLERYLQAPDRVGYLDEFELVAFDEEMSLR
ncbi:hypothetical protein ACFL5A_02540 [Gemmatimonadota bacterium]